MTPSFVAPFQSSRVAAPVRPAEFQVIFWEELWAHCSPPFGEVKAIVPMMEKLLLLKEKIEKVSVWPAGMQTMKTVFSVVAISVLPIVLEVILRLLLGK
jgi:hypothetical protein